METQQVTAEQVANLEEEVACAERKLESLTASIRAAVVEIHAARDPAQFYVGTPEKSADHSAVTGFFAGVVSGTCICMILSLVLRLVGH